MERPGQTRPPRWLLLVAAALVWTSADGERHTRRAPRSAPRIVARSVAPAPRPAARVVEVYYPAPPAP